MSSKPRTIWANATGAGIARSPCTWKRTGMSHAASAAGVEHCRSARWRASAAVRSASARGTMSRSPASSSRCREPARSAGSNATRRASDDTSPKRGVMSVSRYCSFWAAARLVTSASMSPVWPPLAALNLSNVAKKWSWPDSTPSRKPFIDQARRISL